VLDAQPVPQSLLYAKGIQLDRSSTTSRGAALKRAPHLGPPQVNSLNQISLEEWWALDSATGHPHADSARAFAQFGETRFHNAMPPTQYDPCCASGSA